ncbi:hypothetical protein [Fonticella tunisiensis]|uniref:hypothetical protein n=1 Tax=Fonticella tunisiensis TaxID=1096341 RepID=UPI001A9AC48E|nr:hypothetical protein [Fonticella tunisiensis]
MSNNRGSIRGNGGIKISTNNPGCLGVILKLLGVNLKKGNVEEAKLPYGLRDDFLSPAELSFYKV